MDGRPQQGEASGLSGIGSSRIAVAAALTCLLASMLFSARVADVRPKAGRTGAAGDDDRVLLAISRQPVLAFGFRNLLADLTWFQAVQVAGNREMKPEDYRRLVVLLNAVANFDPRFEIPYILGGLIVGESPAHARDAIALLSRGRKAYPDDWRLPFYLGYTHYFVLSDPVAGGNAMADAARLPGGPAYLPRLAARMLSEGRNPDAALSFLAVMIRQENDSARRGVLERRFREVLVERDLQVLERAVEAYRSRTGVVPRDLSDLASAGLLAVLPEEPNGGRYRIAPDGSVYSDRTRQRLKVLKK